MAGVITGKARSTTGWRTRSTDPHVIKGVSKTGMTGGYVDPATASDGRKSGRKTTERRKREIALAEKKAAKKASRHRNRKVTA